MTPLEVLLEKKALQDVSKLDALWAGKPTFVLVRQGGPSIRSWLQKALPQVPDRYRTDCFGLMTSGSTGSPKLIIGNKARSDSLALVLHDLQDSEPIMEALCTLPLSYSYSYVNQWLWARTFGRSLLLSAGFSRPDSLLEDLSNTRHSMLCMVGTQVPLIRRYFPNLVFPGVIRLHFAGGRFPQEHLEFLQERFPNAQIYNNYGCAEAMPRLTLRRAEDASEAANVGRALPGVELRTDDEKRLLFRSPYRAVALVDEAGFRPIADDEWLPTGDLGEPVGDGSWRLLGRANEVFKRHGEKISLASLLTSVRASWGGDAAFYRETDPQGEEACVLVLSPQPDDGQLREVLHVFRKHYTRPHWPIRIESMEQLPLLANGKPDLVGLKSAPDKQLHWRQRI